ncbi:MAG: methylmalonyl-CoA epimerase [Anaerolineales bacterium]|jgi:methylmalonyl-CoA/ethylmalonyl-CoA epimerase
MDHVAMVVEDIEAALVFWRDVLGLPLSHVEDVADQEAAVAFLPLDGSEVELAKPTTEGSGIARYLQKRGPGIHHVCFEVDDLEAMLERLKAAGVRLIHEEPVIGTGGKKIAFLHPQSTHGVLVELYQLTPQEAERRRPVARGLVDRARAEGQVMSAAVLGFLRALVHREGDPRADQKDRDRADRKPS